MQVDQCNGRKTGSYTVCSSQSGAWQKVSDSWNDRDWIDSKEENTQLRQLLGLKLISLVVITVDPDARQFSIEHEKFQSKGCRGLEHVEDWTLKG